MANLFTHSRLFIACAVLSVPVAFIAMALLIRGAPTHPEYSDLSDTHQRLFTRLGLGLLVLLGVVWCMLAWWLS